MIAETEAPSQTQTDGVILSFGGYEMVLNDRKLFKDGEPQRIGQRAFDLLAVLATPPLRQHTAEALRQAVWVDSDVDLNNLRVQIAALRKLLGRDAISFQVTRGYRFELPVQASGPGRVEGEDLGSPALVGNLPEYQPQLLGREGQLQSLQQAVQQTRLITLKGEGGAGKTVMAMACAQRSARAFRDGVWWVDLAPLASGSLVVGAVASTLGRVLPEDKPLAVLGSMLATQRLLLVLDNCEHVAPAVTALCDRLLKDAPLVHLLCTSRRPLKAAGEQVWAVEALDLPTEISVTAARRSGAVSLFEARVQAADARFKLTAANLKPVVEICQRLDGLAFALVLAAARVPVLGVNGVLQRLDERLGWALGENVVGEARHLSLQATLDWSYGLLSAAEQQVFRRLGVFAGSFSLDAVLHVVTDDELDTAALLKALQRLVEHSLLVIEEAALLGEVEGPPRYTLHESVRLYAQTALQASAEEHLLRRKHASYFRAVGQRHNPFAPGGREPMPALHPDLDNLRTAITWSTQHEPLLAMTLCADCCFTWLKLGFHEEARRHIKGLLALPYAPEQAMPRVDMLVGLCAIEKQHEDFVAVLAQADAALALLEGQDEPARRGRALRYKTLGYAALQEYEAALALLPEQLGEFRRAGDFRGLRNALNNLGYLLLTMGRFDEARTALQESLTMDTPGYGWGLLGAHENLGQLELHIGQPARAVIHLEAAVALSRENTDAYSLAVNLAFLALARRRLGQPRVALAVLAETLQLSLQQGFEGPQIEAGIVLAGAFLETGQAARALSTVRLVRRRWAKQLARVLQFLIKDFEHTESLARQQLDVRAQHEACALGDTLDFNQLPAWAASAD